MRRHAEATRRDFVNIHTTSPSAPPSYGQVAMHRSSIADASSALAAAQFPTTPRLYACCDSAASPKASRRRLCSARPTEVFQISKGTPLLISFAFTPRLFTSDECFLCCFSLPPSLPLSLKDWAAAKRLLRQHRVTPSVSAEALLS